MKPDGAFAHRVAQTLAGASFSRRLAACPSPEGSAARRWRAIRLVESPSMSFDGYDETVRAGWLRSPFISLAIAVALAAFVRQQSAIDAANVAELHAKRIERELKFVHQDRDRLAGRISSTSESSASRRSPTAP